MEISEQLRQAIYWLLLLLEITALIAAISWPRIPGKPWLVSSLALTTVNALYFRCFDACVRWFTEEPRWGLYERFDKLNLFMMSLSLAAAALLIVGLFRVRSFLKSPAASGLAVPPPPPVPARASWPARGGTFFGPYRVHGRNSVGLARNATISILEDDRVVVDGKYDPPGTLLLAFLATILGLVFFVVMLRALGFAAAPGWLVWYIIILLIRRRPVTFNLKTAEAIVTDSSASRVAFKAPLGGRSRWFALQVRERFGDVLATLKTAVPPERLSEGPIARPSLVPIVLLLILILTIPLFIALVFYFTQR
ncbi:MAG: hypothetical protein AB7O62_08675 [Pirellulales bacterium]